MKLSEFLLPFVRRSQLRMQLQLQLHRRMHCETIPRFSPALPLSRHRSQSQISWHPTRPFSTSPQGTPTPGLEDYITYKANSDPDFKTALLAVGYHFEKTGDREADNDQKQAKEIIIKTAGEELWNQIARSMEEFWNENPHYYVPPGKKLVSQARAAFQQGLRLWAMKPGIQDMVNTLKDAFRYCEGWRQTGGLTFGSMSDDLTTLQKHVLGVLIYKAAAGHRREVKITGWVEPESWAAAAPPAPKAPSKAPTLAKKNFTKEVLSSTTHQTAAILELLVEVRALRQDYTALQERFENHIASQGNPANTQRNQFGLKP